LREAGVHETAGAFVGGEKGGHLASQRLVGAADLEKEGVALSRRPLHRGLE
jgi:hypothetical protein